MMKRFTLALTLAFGACAGLLTAQDAPADPCKAWSLYPQQDQDAAENAHVVYRGMMSGDLAAAEPNWRKAYEMAPAADGQRPFHYMDGRTIYLDKFAKATDPAQKDEYAAMIARFYDEERQCYQDEANLYGRQVYDMFYTMQRPYPEIYPVAVKAMESGGDSTSSTVLTPVGYLTTYMFTNDLIDQAEARKTIEMARGIAESKESSAQAADYATALQGLDAAVAPIEKNVFDCDYFKAKLEPEYRAAPNDPEVYSNVYRQLISVGCEKVDPLLVEIGLKDSLYRDSVYMADNPVGAGERLYREGDIDGALAKWEEGAGTAQSESAAAIYLRMSSVYRQDKNSLSQARNYARKAADARPGWGKPYLAIGDMYASSSRSCSDDPLKQRLVILAALEQYGRAKSDPESAADAQERINRYSSSIPTKEMVFQQGFKDGQSMNTGCWVGETVRLRTAG